ncbi:MAG: VTT domain-containing protein [Clostridia bacterium]|nr:VTT domain-containing protein [Clostridia bacterium]
MPDPEQRVRKPEYPNNRNHITLIRRCLKGCTLLIPILLSAFLLQKFIAGRLDSVSSLQNYVHSHGLLAPVIMTFLQAEEVVIPIIPSSLGCAVDAMLFGTWGGFLCSFIGISAGSIIAYCLARIYGTRIVDLIYSPKKYIKLRDEVEKQPNRERYLFTNTLLDLVPGDFLSYFSGFIRMNAKKFLFIIILGRPWFILVYSVIFGILGQIA